MAREKFSFVKLRPFLWLIDNYEFTCAECWLNGWVRNLPSGQVEVLAQGEKEKIEKLISWCKKGPPSAKVSDVKIEWQEVSKAFAHFEIK